MSPEPRPLRDFSLPSRFEPCAVEKRSLAGQHYVHGAFDQKAIEHLLERLERAGESLRSLSKDRLWAAWRSTVAAFLDSSSPQRLGIANALTASSRLSPPALNAGLKAILEGVQGQAARALLDQAPCAADAAPAVLILPGNLPGLIVQSLLPALAVGRPMAIKSASIEPFFSPAFVETLAQREPVLADALAVLAWRSGTQRWEELLLAGAGPVIAYGDQETAQTLTRRCGPRATVYGPKLSIAILDAATDPQRSSPGLARDIALFDQRGCLSIHAVFTTGSARALARFLAEELSRLALEWPPGAALPAELAGLRQALSEAEIRGLEMVTLGEGTNGAGTVIIEPELALRPAPGMRCVRVHRVADLSQLPEILASWAGKLQGAALAGKEAWGLAPRLAELGFSRFAAPGDLQATDALWFNGGIDPLAALS